jgi:hypothetical protein
MRLMMPGLTDAAFEQRFGAEDACLAALAAARQAAGRARKAGGGFMDQVKCER